MCDIKCWGKAQIAHVPRNLHANDVCSIAALNKLDNGSHTPLTVGTTYCCWPAGDCQHLRPGVPAT